MLLRALLLLAGATVALMWWRWYVRRPLARVDASAVRRWFQENFAPSSARGETRFSHLIALFSTPTCSYCPPLARHLRDLAADSNDSVHFTEIKLATTPEIGEIFRVKRTPHIVVLDRNGTVVWEMSGNPEQLPGGWSGQLQQLRRIVG